MTGRPLFIVTSPSRGVDSAQADIREASGAGADLVEIRLDLWPRSDLATVPELFPSKLPLLATLRSRAEGGDGPDDPGERRAILETVVALPFDLVDLEVERDLGGAPLGPRSGNGHRPRWVLSTHLHAGWSPEKLREALRRTVPGAAFVKVIAPAPLSRVWTEVLPALPPIEEGPIVLHTTGGSGPLLRCLARRLGFAAVYCATSAGPRDAGHREPPVEASQLPVDWLRPHLDAPEGSAPRFALLGHPVDRSRSPGIHAGWMAELGLPGVYIALDAETEEEFTNAVPRLAGLGFRGVNVTRPWKSAALELATASSRAADWCGCANTLTFDGDEVTAENTDLVAVLDRLRALRTEGWPGEELVVVGAGGAARAAVAAAATIGTRTTVIARDEDAAGEFARRWGTIVGDVSRPIGSTLLVNATPVGQPETGPLGFEIDPWIAPGGHVLDFVYAASDRAFALAAARRGATYEDGAELLQRQAAAAFEIWWGRPPPAPAMASESEVRA